MSNVGNSYNQSNPLLRYNSGNNARADKNMQPPQLIPPWLKSPDVKLEYQNHIPKEIPLHDSQKNFRELNALPSGKAFKEGTKIMLPAKAFDVYHMNALYADTNNISGDVKEINGNLYARGENPIIEYSPKEQIIQPNNHISGAVKNAEADKRLEMLNHQTSNTENSLSGMLPNILLGAIAGAISGALLHSPLLMIGSLGVGGASIHLANESFKKSSQEENDNFKKKIASFS